MIINQQTLLSLAPIKNMEKSKIKRNGVSYGLTEAGYDIRAKQDIILNQTDRFCLASSIEEFDVPTTLVGVVHDKSTWARMGLSVFNTVIEQGWRGFLTLELVYHGKGELIIPAGTGIAQVLFHEVKNSAIYTGKYQNQKDEPIEAIFE